MKKIFILFLLSICITIAGAVRDYEVHYYITLNNINQEIPDIFLKSLEFQHNIKPAIKTQGQTLTEVEKAILDSNPKTLKVLLEKKPCITQNKLRRPVIKEYNDKYKKTKIVYVLNHVNAMLLAEELFYIRVDLFKNLLKSFLPEGETLSEISDQKIKNLCMKLKPEGKVLTLLENFKKIHAK